MISADLTKHETQKCLERPTKCKDCHKTMTHLQLLQHGRTYKCVICENAFQNHMCDEIYDLITFCKENSYYKHLDLHNNKDIYFCLSESPDIIESTCLFRSNVVANVILHMRQHSGWSDIPRLSGIRMDAPDQCGAWIQ